MRIAILLAAVTCAWAQSGLDRSVLGQMIDRQSVLRPVYGVGGSFHTDAPVAQRVLSSACAGTICLAKTESALISGPMIVPAPPGDAKIALDSSGATIYFPSVQQFGRWQNGALTPLTLSPALSNDGTVLALGSGPSGLVIAVERAGTVWIVSSDGTTAGTILDSLPPGTGTVLLTANGVVYATANALILRKSDGSELSFAASGIEDLFQLGDGYVEARAAGVIYALRTTPGRERLFQLPQTEPRR